MPYYRAHSTLAAGSRTIQRGTIFPATLLRPDVIAALEGRHISRVNAPPLAELPGWSRRAKKLADAGIVSVEDFLDATDGDALSSIYKPEQLARWRNELMGWLVPPKAAG